MKKLTKKQREELRPFIVAGIRANTAKWDAESAIEHIIGREVSDFTDVWDMPCVDMDTPDSDITDENIDYVIEQLKRK